MKYEIVLVGNPNTGKTTLFNTLTRSNEKASNWHGVTVAVKSKTAKYKGNEICVYDLPGIYDLNGNSFEEITAANFLNKNKNKLIINICDANNFEHNFKLTSKLIAEGYKVIIAVNMSNEIKNYNYNNLSKKLNVPIIEIDARKTGVKTKIFDLIIKYAKNIKPQNVINTNKIQFKYHNLLQNYKLSNAVNPYKLTHKIDKIVLNKFAFPFISLCVLFVAFYITFGPFGSFLSDVFEGLLVFIFNNLKVVFGCLNLNYAVREFIERGLFFSLEIIAQFIPQIVLLTCLFNFLEDIGFMSRVAFMLDGVLLKFGISGKSIFSIMLGYGCTATAVLTTKNLTNSRLRKRTILLIPFSSCSAKLPIYLVIFSLFCSKYKYIFVLILYIFAFLFLFVYGLIINKLFPISDSYTIFEMPKYRFPYFKKVFIDSLAVCKTFIIKAGTSIVFFGALIWFMQNFSFELSFLNYSNFTSSILYNLSRFLLPIFSIIGIRNVGVISVLIFGLVAKELIVVGLAALNGVEPSISALTASLVLSDSLCSFDLLSSIVFAFFVLFYSPCLSALATIKGEVGFSFAAKVFLLQTFIAFFTCFLVYFSFNNFKFVLIILLIIFIVIYLKNMLKLVRNKISCGRKCHDCKGICCR